MNAPSRGGVDDALLDAWPTIRLDADNATYYRGLLERRLLINRCVDCGHWHHPPRSICPRCWSCAIEPTEVSGRGRIALVTILRQGRAEPGIDFTAGHAVVAVDLEEQPGLRVTGGVIGAPAERIRGGERVALAWPPAGARPAYPDFEIVG